jgi:hypothetical protein
MAALRVGGALAIFILFLMILMAAIAQQSVLAQLSQRDVSLGYSSAYVLTSELSDRKRQLPQLFAAERTLNDQLENRQTALREREEDYHTAWGEFLPILVRAQATAGCSIAVEDRRLDEYDVRRAAWYQVEQCARENALPPSLTAQFRALGAGRNSFPVSYRRALAANMDVKAVEGRLEIKRRKLVAAQTLSEEEQAVVRAFDEISLLKSSWLLGSSFIVGFPPSLVQLLLSAASGAFGALLVTLVLIVYPKNPMTLINATGYGPRMLLGALIAVCVYVILLAGTAVLGASSGFDAAGANYMTFCAVSILAGMFSDRAADWLSDRANTFFAKPAGETA